MGEPIDLRDIELKIGRGEEHLAELNRRADQWLSEHAIAVVYDHDRKTGWHEIRGKHIPETPREWGPILGDFGYNLRAALEYTVELLLISNGRTPQRENQFPIVSKIADAHQIERQLVGVPEGAIDVIKSVQPYARREAPKRDALEVIASLANVDKHHRLHGSVVITDRPRSTWFKMTARGAGTISERKIFVNPFDPISDAHFIGFRTDPPGLEFEVGMNDADPPQIDILFRNGEPFLLRVLPQLVVETRSILDKLRPWMTTTS